MGRCLTQAPLAGEQQLPELGGALVSDQHVAVADVRGEGGEGHVLDAPVRQVLDHRPVTFPSIDHGGLRDGGLQLLQTRTELGDEGTGNQTAHEASCHDVLRRLWGISPRSSSET